jgi:NAD(P)-dependent dehydrogenase (short-subunit alcohol dehydrogenase family)
VAVISGGAGGLGRALAAELVTRGWHVVAIDRDVSGVAAPVEAVECDLTDLGARDAALAAVARAHPRIGLAIYCAGVTQIGGFQDLSEATHRRVFEVNYFAAVEMARVLLPNLRADRGTHLAISSVAGFAPLVRRTAYAASKHAMEGFFKTLASEEAPHGVTVQIAAPSFVATNIGRAERQADGIARPGSAPDGIDYMEADAAAAIILRGLERGRPYIPVGRVARAAWWVNALSPRLFRRLMERKVGSQGGGT